MVRKINILKSAKFLVLLCFLFSVNELRAQDLLWKRNFTGVGNNTASKAVIDNQNNIYVLGSFDNTCDGPIPLYTKGGTDIFIAKYDANGSLVWTRQLGSTTNYDVGTGITVSPDGEYIYVTGVFMGTLFADNLSITGTGSTDGFLAKYQKDGKILWLKNIASGMGATVQRPNEIKIDINNHLVIGGLFYSELKLGDNNVNFSFSTTQAEGMFISQFDTSGAVLNAKKFESSSSSSSLYTFDVDANGYYLCGFYKGNLITDIGTKTSNNGSLDMFIYKVGFDLTGQWIIQIAGSGDEQLYSCSVDNRGYFYIGGGFKSASLTVDSTSTGISSKRVALNTTSDGKSDIFFAKYSSSGVLQWFNTAGSTGNDYLYRALYKNGNFIVAGQYGANLTFNNQTLISKVGGDAFAIVHDNSDNLKYLIPITGTGTGAVTGETAVVDNNGNFVVIGDYSTPKIYFGYNKDSLINSNSGTKDMFIAKYDKGSLKKVITPITCHGSASGVIDITPMGTVVAPYTYAWSKTGDPTFTANTEDLNSLTAGTYKVTFTDAVGYTKTDSVTLTDPPLLSVTLSSKTNVSCFNGSNGTINITAAGGTSPYTYVWATANGSGLNATSEDQSTLMAGTYSVTVNDHNGCSVGLGNIAITQPNKMTFKGTAVTDIVSPAKGAVNLIVNGGTIPNTFAWQGPSGFTPPGNIQNLSNLTIAGTYSVHVTDFNSCTADTSVLVNDGTLPVAYIQSKQDVSCYGGSDGSATVDATNFTDPLSLSYHWNNSSTSQTVTGLAAGTYHVTVTDGSSTAYASVIINQPTQLQLVSINKTDIDCHNNTNGILDATITGGTVPYTYQWTKDGVNYANTEDLSGLSQGGYALTVTDARGCTATGSNSIVNPQPISLSATVGPITCENSRNDGAINLDTPTGGWPTYTYAWSNGLTSQNINLLSSGNYTVTVTDSRNCKAMLTRTVGYDSPMAITFVINDVLCKGEATGNASTLVSGGHSPLTYQWNNGSSASGLTGVAAGSYTLTITDSKSCVKSQSLTIGEPASVLDVNETGNGNVTCHGGNNGYLNVAGTGGTPGYGYVWSNGGSGTLNSNLTAANYTVTVVDNNGCRATKTYAVTEPPALMLSENIASHADLICNGVPTGVIA
ncbi:MAG TPA: SBBP repeat-containing protein, partial [Bacteroidales bacterium]